MKSNESHFKGCLICVFVLSLILSSSGSFGDTIHVPGDQPTIQAGIDAASDYDTVLVADGTYTGDGNKNLNFKDKAIHVESENGAQNCTIDGGGDERAFYFHGYGNEVVIGFTITNFSGSGTILCAGQSFVYDCIISGNTSSPIISLTENSSATIYNCTISDNTCDSVIRCSSTVPIYFPQIYWCTITDNRSKYAIISCYNSSPHIASCTIRGNTGEYLHVISCSNGSSPSIRYSTISDNTCGSVIYCSDSSPSINMCTISHNAGTGYNAVWCYNSSPIIANCIISDNEKSAVSCLAMSSPNITNCTITGNTGVSGAIESSASSPAITNCILWNNSPDEIDLALGSTISVIHSDVQGGYPGEGNIDADPLFVGSGDYHLTAWSPCVDAATSEVAPDVDITSDIDNDPRPQWSGYDIGADEYLYQDDDNDGAPDEEEQGPDGTDPNHDGDNDGTPDSQQDNVVSCHTYDRQHYVTLACPDTAFFSDVRAIGNPSPADAPSGVEFPYEFFTFTVNNVDPGGSTTVTIYLPKASDTYYKYGPTQGDATDHWYTFLYNGETGAEINGSIITLHLADGQRGDDDLDDTNGTIVDQGGPGVVSADVTSSGDGGGGGCFIATATFGSAGKTHVTILKHFRDTYLLPYTLGRTLVTTYYKHSPPLAQFIAQHERVRAVVWIGLMPLVGVSYSMLHFGPVITLTMLIVLPAILIFLVSFCQRKVQSKSVAG